jgi:hypothetical protein
MPILDSADLSADHLHDTVLKSPENPVWRDVLAAGAKVALLGAVAGAGVALAPTAQAQVDYTERPGTGSPFDGVDVGDRAAPQLVDFDGDGDLDFVVGRADGTVAYFENTGSAENPSYAERTGSDNPFEDLAVSGNAVVELEDLDADGDFDVVVGKDSGELIYFENTGTSENPSYEQRAGNDNPFSAFDVGDDSAPKLADFDGDGDLDGIVGRADGTIAYLENTGSATNPSYTQRTGGANPFSDIQVDGNAVPGLADADRDGDLDLAIGKANQDGSLNSIVYAENTGTATNPNYTQRTGSDNPFDGYRGANSAPVFGDVDGDGDLDVPVGESDGQVRYLENTGDLTRTPTYSDATDNPFAGEDAGDNAAPALADFDGDGDLDAVSGKSAGDLVYFENTGTKRDPNYESRLGSDNPFNNTSFGGESAPIALDFDGDGDFDVAVGQQDGMVGYLENTGSATNPSFTERTGSDNPFDGFDVGEEAKLGAADIDGDGDLDILSGKASGGLVYFENTGSSTNPDYTRRTGSDNPFSGLGVDGNSAPALTDVDNDGDIDAIVGAQDGSTKYLENIGSQTNPSYTERTGGDNPISNVATSGRTTPRFADLDADDDPDLVLGMSNGMVDVYQYGKTDTLPVELADFSVRSDGKAALLTWSTASERNNAGFEVQRLIGDEKTGAGAYEKLGFVEGSGTTDRSQSYRFRTEDLSAGTHRFRLKQVDTDGSAQYTETRHVEIKIESTYRLVAPTPHPVQKSSQFSLTVEENQNVQIVVFDLMGRQIRTIYGGTLSAQDKRSFELGEGLTSGTYFLNVKGETFSTSKKFVVVE